MELWNFKPGYKLALRDGSRVEVLSATEDGQWIRARYVESPDDPSLVGTEDLVADHEVVAFTPAPAGPEWGDEVGVVLHHVRESEEGEGGYEATTMKGVPYGLIVTRSDADSKEEALAHLGNGLRAMGYSGRMVVDDVTEPGRRDRYELEV